MVTIGSNVPKKMFFGEEKPTMAQKNAPATPQPFSCCGVAENSVIVDIIGIKY